MNTKGHETYHLVVPTGMKPKVDLKPPWAIPLTVSVYGAVTAHAEYSIESAFASIFAKRVASPLTSSEFDLNRFKTRCSISIV